MKNQSILIGPHMSIADGLDKAAFSAKKLNATTMQIFTANQQRWTHKKISCEEIEKWKNALAETSLQKIASHMSYLVNLGSPKKEVFVKSKKNFQEEIARCQDLGISYLVFHPGAALDSSQQECLDKICSALVEMEDLFPNDSLTLLIETTAGQGTNVGYTFEHLGYILQKVGRKIPIGVCIDTCHIFAAGYDIRTKKGWMDVLEEFDKKINLKNLHAFHINDSMHDLGERKDRHANLGEGKIPLHSFEFLMQDPRTKYLPKYLETPGGEKVWEKEIQMLLNFSKK